MLDREQADTHLLIVKASEDCITSPKIDQPVIFDPHDDTMLRVVVKVNDINDNSPKFMKKVFTGGVTTESDFGTEFMQIKVVKNNFVLLHEAWIQREEGVWATSFSKIECFPKLSVISESFMFNIGTRIFLISYKVKFSLHLQAIDADTGINAELHYFIISDAEMSLSEGLDNIQMPPFTIDEHTGSIFLNFDPQREMKGYFDFYVSKHFSNLISLKDFGFFIFLLKQLFFIGKSK